MCTIVLPCCVCLHCFAVLFECCTDVINSMFTLNANPYILSPTPNSFVCQIFSQAATAYLRLRANFPTVLYFGCCTGTQTSTACQICTTHSPAKGSFRQLLHHLAGILKPPSTPTRSQAKSSPDLAPMWTPPTPLTAQLSGYNRVKHC